MRGAVFAAWLGGLCVDIQPQARWSCESPVLTGHTLPRWLWVRRHQTELERGVPSQPAAAGHGSACAHTAGPHPPPETERPGLSAVVRKPVAQGTGWSRQCIFLLEKKKKMYV